MKGNILRAVAVLGLATGTMGTCLGDFTITGQFGNDFAGVSGLAGGSFDVTFSGPIPLPTPGGGGDIYDFAADFKNSSGTVLYTLTSAYRGIIEIERGSYNASGIEELIVARTDGYPLGIELTFAYPYDGTGSILPGTSNFAGTPGGSVYVVSGESGPTGVPEPSSLLLMGLAAPLAAGYTRLRRRGKH